MNIHKNARLTPLRREEMALAVAKGQVSKAQAARLYGVSSKIVSRWVERFRAQGRAGMADRSSRPYVHICIDDASRIAFTDIFPDETAVSGIEIPFAVSRKSTGFPCLSTARDKYRQLPRILT
ncbi:hypothetical protein ABIA10_007343 [Rhizobium leguminosarum]